MNITKPSYYDAFHCMAGDCPDTCCGGWQVVIDQDSEAFYRQVEGELGQALRHAMVQVDGQTCFDLNEENHCVLLTDQGLCPIQAQLGEAHLCTICGSYPRFSTEIGGRRWIGISLSCPEAARLIMQTPTTLLHIETSEPIRDYNDIPPERVLTAQRLMEEALALLNQPYALVRLLRLCAPVAKPLRPKDLPRALEAGLAAAGKPIVPTTADLEHFFSKLRQCLSQLEPLNHQWHERLCRVSAHSVTEYALARYAVYKYFPRAAFDGSFWVTGVFAALFPILLQAQAGEDALKTAWSLSREIEHSEENMHAMLEGLSRRPFRPKALERVFSALSM